MSNNLWKKIENRNNNRKAYTGLNNTDTSLYRAILADKTPANNNTQNIMGGINDGLKGLGILAGTLKNNTGSDNTNWGSIGTAANNFITGSGGSDGSAIVNAINGTGGAGSAITDAINTNVGGGEGLGSTSGWIGIANGAMNAGKSAFDGGSWGDDVPQSFFGIDSKNDSDVMQALKGAGQGAMMGLPFGGPIGAAIGGVLGLGASFLDDI